MINLVLFIRKPGVTAGNGIAAILSRASSSVGHRRPKPHRCVHVKLHFRLVSVVRRLVVEIGEIGAFRRAMEAGHGGRQPEWERVTAFFSLFHRDQY
jgi:hypothetical protein